MTEPGRVLRRGWTTSEAWRGTRVGMWAWLIQRAAAIGLLVVIALHLANPFRRPVQAALNVAGLLTQTASFLLADAIAAVEPVDPLLEVVDPHLQVADTAVIVAVPVVAITVIAVAVVVTVRLRRRGRRIVLGGCRSRESDCRNCGSGGNQNLTHHLALLTSG